MKPGLHPKARSNDPGPCLAGQQRRRLLLAGFGAAAGVLLPGLAHANELVLGKAAPPLILHTLDGQQIATTALTGKVVIATFWATYCDPCRDELPLLSAYAAAHAAQGLQVLGFCIDPPSNIAEVKRIASTLSFPVGIMDTPYAGGYGRIWRMPVSFVIDRNGRLVDNGWLDDNPIWTAQRLHRVMDPLLAQR